MSPVSPPSHTYDVFLAFCPGATMLLGSELTSIGADGAARVKAVDLYYRSETDVALVRLRLDATLSSHTFLTSLRETAAAAGASVLEPSRLPAEERDRFYEEHLAQYPFEVHGFPTVADAARKLRIDLGSWQPPAPSTGDAQVTMRWRAGDRWSLARPRNLTREGFYAYASAPPRASEVVTMVLQAGDDSLTLRATVIHVTPDDAAVTVGGPGFGGRFILDRPEERSVLERIVKAGRVDGLGTLRAAPARREARYTVRWPVTLDAAATVMALDLSRHGLFVALPGPLPPGSIALRLVSDDGGEPLHAEARVARVVSEARGGISAGVGLELAAFAPGDADRYEALVWRVGERSRRHLVVAGSGARVAQAAARLSAAGYVITAAPTRPDLDRLVATSRPDLVVHDARLPAPASVPAWSLDDDRGDELVSAIDGALLPGR